LCRRCPEDGEDLSGIVFDMTEKGRPYLRRAQEFRFSFSSCRFGMLGAWSATCAVGIDIEDNTRDIAALALAREFFTSDEASVVEQANSADRGGIFYLFWSLKEAALKSIGEGLPYGLDSFAFDLLPAPRVVDAPEKFGSPGQFRAYLVGQGSFNAALVTHVPAGNIR
jgi:4'-phosphopantetheinyl transferase